MKPCKLNLAAKLFYILILILASTSFKTCCGGANLEHVHENPNFI